MAHHYNQKKLMARDSPRHEDGSEIIISEKSMTIVPLVLFMLVQSLCVCDNFLASSTVHKKGQKRKPPSALTYKNIKISTLHEHYSIHVQSHLVQPL